MSLLKTNRLFILLLLYILFPVLAKADSILNFVVPNGLGVASHFTAAPNPRDFDLVIGSGIRIVRTSLDWHRVEKKKGVYDFSEYLQLADVLAVQGVRPLFILAYGNPLYDGSAWPHHDAINTSESKKGFEAFAFAAGAAFKNRQVLWEIWNEPNLKRFWRPKPNAREYVELVRVAVAGLRKSDPSAIIIAPSLASGPNIGGYYLYLEECFQYGLLDLVNAIGVHPYRNENPETVINYYENIRKLIRKYLTVGKTELPILCTEWGYSLTMVSTDEQADFAVRMYLVNLSNGVPLTIWYDWRDTSGDKSNREHNFGLIRQDYSVKPAYHALKEMVNELSGYKFVQRFTTSDKDDWIILLEKDGSFKIAAWAIDDHHENKIYFQDEILENKKVIKPISIKLTTKPRYYVLEYTEQH